eukprot:GHVR01047012.1.p1 GENE.GHVR01047012.1~~GHVR01047012.1.p1  ORF type:complete len:119 (+),score=18.41 GHVR01047012.1:335-691(+)
MVVEYIGEVVRVALTDRRERSYELEKVGDGSCYMFKLAHHKVVDATKKGNLARFMNHCCTPNCYCKVVTDEMNTPHIVVIAKHEILPAEEITYDYQFNVEEEKLLCRCGAPNCLGRMN